MTSCIVCCDAAATVYCCQDDASLCKACSAKIHSANLVAARHTILPFCAVCNIAPPTVFCRNDDAFLCAACDQEAHTGLLASRHDRVPANAASKEVATKITEDVFAESSSGANSEACRKHMEQTQDFNDLVSLGSDFGVVPVFFAPEEAEEPKEDLLEKQVWGKEFESLDIDAGWLDRLDMGFDFSDILADSSLPDYTGDDAGLVPTMSTSFAKEEEVPVLSTSFIKEEQEQVAYTVTPFEAPAPAPAKRKAVRRVLVDDESEEEFEEEEEEQSDDDYDVPAYKSRKQARCVATTVRIVAPQGAGQMHSGREECASYQMPAATTAVSAAQAAINRLERVAKCREKRKNRTYEKTIRYATRKAYAEVRPRIKGRFVKKEELDAYRAKYGRGMFDVVEEGVVPELI